MEQYDAEILAQTFSQALGLNISVDEAIRLAAIMKIFFNHGVDGLERKVEVRDMLAKDSFMVQIPANYFARLDEVEILGEVIYEIFKVAVDYGLKAGRAFATPSDSAHPVYRSIHPAAPVYRTIHPAAAFQQIQQHFMNTYNKSSFSIEKAQKIAQNMIDTMETAKKLEADLQKRQFSIDPPLLFPNKLPK